MKAAELSLGADKHNHDEPDVTQLTGGDYDGQMSCTGMSISLVEASFD